MLRCWLGLIAILTALGLLPILLIRTQPYNDANLRVLLNCLSPCFMGIRPGITTVGEAINLLEAQPAFTNTIGLNPPYGIRFRANQPDSLIADSVFSYLERESNIVKWLRIHTNLSLGEVWAAYGQPDWGTRTYTLGSSLIYYAIGYDESDISFEFAINIEQGQIALADIFRHKVTLRIGSTLKAYANMQPRLRQYTSPDLSWWHAS